MRATQKPGAPVIRESRNAADSTIRESRTVGEPASVPAALVPAEPDYEYLAAMAGNLNLPMQLRAQLASVVRAAGERAGGD